jgi:hypothetical protein
LGLCCTDTKSLGQPELNRVGAIIRFPFFKSLVVAAFGYARLLIFVGLHLAWLTAAIFCLGSRDTSISLRVEQIGDVFEAINARFELNLLLQASITLKSFERLKLFGEVPF